MTKIKVTILNSDTEVNDRYYSQQAVSKMKLKESVPIFSGFEGKKKIGELTKIKYDKKSKSIIGEGIIEEGFVIPKEARIVPSLYCDYESKNGKFSVKDLELIDTALTINPIDKNLTLREIKGKK